MFIFQYQTLLLITLLVKLTLRVTVTAKIKLCKLTISLRQTFYLGSYFFKVISVTRLPKT